MTDFMPKWQQFQDKIKVQEVQKKKKLDLQEKLEIINEISRDAADRIYDWMADKDITDYSFDGLFNGALRVAVAMESSDQKNLQDIVYQLNHEGWRPHKEQTDVEIISQAMGGPAGTDFAIEKVKQKKRRLDTGEEYEEEVEVARLNVARTTSKVIPKGPKAGQTVEKTEKTSMSKAVNKSKDIEERLKKWWQQKQTFYTKERNWNKIASAFTSATYGAEPTGDMSVIISRHPIDVLRMSDIGNIRSCHSEGSGYFQCAVAEAKGHGPIAYLVPTKELDYFLSGDDAEHRRRNFAKGNAPHLNIENFDDKEIFADNTRGVEGMRATARLRLRKYEDTNTGNVFAAPESRTYGKSEPGFLNFVRSWSFENQKEMFATKSTSPSMEGITITPAFSDLLRYGGSYGDTKDGDTLNKFFMQGKLASEEEPYDTYRDVLHDGEDEEEDLWDQYAQRSEELIDHANNTLKYASVHADVEDTGDGQPYVYYSAGYGVELPAELFKNEDGEVIAPSDDWQIAGALFDAVKEALDEMRGYVYFDDMNYYLNHVGGRPTSMLFNFDIRNEDFEPDPDGLESFIDWIDREYEGEHKKITEAVRKALVREEHITAQPYDVKIAELQGEEPEYDYWDYSIWDDDASIVYKTQLHRVEFTPDRGEMRGKLAPVNLHASTVGRKYPLRDYNPQSSFSPSFYKNMTKELQKIEDDAAQYARKQLTLPGVEVAQADKVLDLPLLTKRKNKTGKFEAILTISLPARLVGGEQWIVLNMELEITPEATEAQVQAVSKFVEYVDKHMYQVLAAARRAIAPLIDETNLRRELADKLPSPEEISNHLKHMPLYALLEFSKGFFIPGSLRISQINELRKKFNENSERMLHLISLKGGPWTLEEHPELVQQVKEVGEELGKVPSMSFEELADLFKLRTLDEPTWDITSKYMGTMSVTSDDFYGTDSLDSLISFINVHIENLNEGLAMRIWNRFRYAVGLETNWRDPLTGRTYDTSGGQNSDLKPTMKQIMSAEPSNIAPPWYTEVFKKMGLAEQKLKEQKQKELIREAIREAIQRTKWN